MRLEEMMLKDGWRKATREGSGKEYVEFHKMGFVIDEEDIIEEDIIKGAEKDEET